MPQLTFSFEPGERITRRSTLPYQGNTAIARECSRAAAKRAAVGRDLKRAQYLRWLEVHGPASDHQAREHFGWPMSSINSIRNGLGSRVRAAGKVPGPYGVDVTTWEVVRG